MPKNIVTICRPVNYSFDKSPGVGIHYLMISRPPKYAAHIGFERGIRGCTEAAQRVSNRRAGAEISYTSKEVTGEWIVHQHPEPPTKGKGVAIYVYMLALLTDEGIEQLADMVAEVAASYSVIVESATGLRTDDPKQRRIMLDFARASISCRRRARLPAGLVKPGRRAGEFSDEAMALAEKIWFSKKYASDPIAAEHLPEGMTINQARRLFKKSGRPPGRKPQQKRKT